MDFFFFVDSNDRMVYDESFYKISRCATYHMGHLLIRYGVKFTRILIFLSFSIPQQYLGDIAYLKLSSIMFVLILSIFLKNSLLSPSGIFDF